MNTKTEKQLNEEIDSLHRKLHEESLTLTGAETNKIHEDLKALQLERYALLGAGGKTCVCGHDPIGMIKTPAHVKDGLDIPAVYEVGCGYCPPFLVEREDGTELVIDGEVKKLKRRSLSARAFSQQEAAERWNEGLWVEDAMFDRIPSFTPVYP